jgi:hypothetical protein
MKPPAEFANRDDIDPNKWGKKPNLDNPDDRNEETINGYILYCWNYYKGKYDDALLWEYFREDFDGWTKEIFTLGNAQLVREFRDFLRTYGCFVSRDGTSVPAALQKTLEEEEQHQWTEDEIKYQLKYVKKFYSLWNPNNMQSDKTPDETPDETLDKTLKSLPGKPHREQQSEPPHTPYKHWNPKDNFGGKNPHQDPPDQH